jgi:hypothetical protein
MRSEFREKIESVASLKDLDVSPGKFWRHNSRPIFKTGAMAGFTLWAAFELVYWTMMIKGCKSVQGPLVDQLLGVLTFALIFLFVVGLYSLQGIWLWNRVRSFYERISLESESKYPAIHLVYSRPGTIFRTLVFPDVEFVSPTETIRFAWIEYFEFHGKHSLLVLKLRILRFGAGSNAETLREIAGRELASLYGFTLEGLIRHSSTAYR